MIWLNGLVAAGISGAASSISVMVVDYDHFNLTTGLKHLGLVALVSAVIGVAGYLKQSPLPTK